MSLSICNTSIRQSDELYSLNDLHKASGNAAKNRPSLFLVNQQTKDLVDEILNAGIPAFKSARGAAGGTYACKELIIAYAAWLSPAIHLQVIRVFLNQIEPQPVDQKRLSDKADRVPLKDAVNLLVAKAKNLNYSEAYTMVHQRFNIESVDELTAEQLPAVVEYVHRMIGSWEHAPIALPTAAPQIDPSQLTVHRNHVLHMYQTARQLVREIDMLGMTQEDLPKYLLA